MTTDPTVPDAAVQIVVKLTADQINALIHACIDAEAADDQWREASRYGVPPERQALARARHSALPLLRAALDAVADEAEVTPGR